MAHQLLSVLLSGFNSFSDRLLTRENAMLLRLRTKAASATTGEQDPFLTLGPVKLCCGQRHHGVQCPDGLVMCCLCFERVGKEELVTQIAKDGVRVYLDVCRPCNEMDMRAYPGPPR